MSGLNLLVVQVCQHVRIVSIMQLALLLLAS